MGRRKYVEPPLTPETTWLSRTQVCIRYGITPHVLDQWERAGLPALRIPGTRARYNRATLEGWLDQHVDVKRTCDRPAGQVA